MTDSNPITLFVNPVAGKGRCNKKYPLAVQYLQEAGVDCDVFVSQYPGHITRASSELAARGQQTVAACGGDGTVNELVNGIAGTDTAMGIVPLGLSNNYASDLGISSDMRRACSIITARNHTRTDLIRVNDDRLLTGNAFIALETEVATFTRAQRKNKTFLQTVQCLGSFVKFLSFQSKTVELRLDGDRFFGEVLLVTFENPLSSFAGPSSHGSQANYTGEPLLQVCVVEASPRWKRASRLAALRKRHSSKQGGLSFYRTDAVHVQALRPLGFYSNDDFVTSTPFRLQLMPNHLNVIVPTT